MPEPVPIILDTDIGEDVDDLYALTMAGLHPWLDLRAVTTVHGDVQARARLAAKALRLMGRSGVPVGAGIPMSRDRQRLGQRDPDPWAAGSHTDEVTPADQEHGVFYPPASVIMAEAVRSGPSPVVLVGIGPLSNLAAALEEAAGLGGKIRGISVMGGSTATSMCEHNIRGDPEAAQRVFDSSLPVFMATYEVSRRLQMTMEQAESWLSRRPEPLCQLLWRCTKAWAPHRGWKPGPVLYDLLPLFWLTDGEQIQTRPATIRVECEDLASRGRTVRVRDQGTVTEITDFPPEVFLRSFLRLCGIDAD